jgi:Alginate export
MDKASHRIGYWIVVAVLIGLPNCASAQFILSGELRPRTELRRGYKTLAVESSEAALIVSQRSRLNLDYKDTNFRVFLSVQDIRVWGDEEHLKDVSSIAMHEAWGELFLSKKLSVKVGRQELVYDDHRLLGNVNWEQQARSHDAMVLKFKDNGWKAHLGFAYNNATASLFKTKYTLNNYRVLSFFWLNKTFAEKLKFSFVGLTDGFQSTDSTSNILYRGTVGPLMELKTGAWQLKSTFYYQFGKNANKSEISAFLLALYASYKLKNLTLGTGVDYLSGTDALDADNNKNNSFHTLYATNHKFYGFMDYFLNIPANTQGGGLTDIYGQVNYKFSTKTSFASTFHYFLLSDNVIDPENLGSAINKGLGAEIDLVLNYQILPRVNIKGGWSVMLPSSSMEVLKGGDKNEFQYWGWMMLTFKPEFFNSTSQGAGG